jgi:hypothetical protein
MILVLNCDSQTELADAEVRTFAGKPAVLLGSYYFRCQCMDLVFWRSARASTRHLPRSHRISKPTETGIKLLEFPGAFNPRSSTEAKLIFLTKVISSHIFPPCTCAIMPVTAFTNMCEHRQYDYDCGHRTTGEIVRCPGLIAGTGCTGVTTPYFGAANGKCAAYNYPTPPR